MKINKKVFFQIHSWIGLRLSILFFIVCFSGTLATLSHEMDWLFFPESRAVHQDQKVSFQVRVDKLQAAYPDGQFSNYFSAEEPYLCDYAQVILDGKRRFVFVNPYTGEIQGDQLLTFRRFFRDFHYFLFIPFQIGHFTVLLFGFILFASLMTALLFYKKWWRKLFKLNIGKGKVAFYKSLHMLVGTWSVPFAILFSVTGIWYFVERTNLGGVSSIANFKRPEIEAVAVADSVFTQFIYDIDYNRSIAVAEQVVPGLKVMDILVPSNQEKPIYLSGKSDVPLVRNRANQVFLHPQTYEVIKVRNAQETGAITWLNDIADPLHFGTWGGLITKVIWFFGGLGISTLVLTGIWIALKRKMKNKKLAQVKYRGFWKFFTWIIISAMTFCLYGYLTIYYAMPWEVIAFITVILGIFAYLGWYLFVAKLKAPSSVK